MERKPSAEACRLVVETGRHQCQHREQGVGTGTVGSLGPGRDVCRDVSKMVVYTTVRSS
jgi:hypothetical protein